MKKILIVTFRGNEKKLSRSLKGKNKTDFKELTVLAHQYGISEWIRKERPEVIILNGELHFKILSALNSSIGDVLGRFDIPCLRFVIGKQSHLPGVIHIRNIQDALTYDVATTKFSLYYDPEIPESVTQRNLFEEVLKSVKAVYEVYFGDFSEPSFDEKACAAVYPSDGSIYGGYRGESGLHFLKQRFGL